MLKLLSITIALLLTTASTFARDIISLKDESLIKGTIVEHNLIKKQYKVQTDNGSIFVLQEDQILSITKEIASNTLPNKTAAPNANSSIIINNTNNNQDIVANNAIPVATTAQQPAKKWKLFAGALKMTETIEVDCGGCWNQGQELLETIYSGSNWGASYAFSNNLLLRFSKLAAEAENKLKHGDLTYDATTTEILFTSNSLHIDWNWYIGLGYIAQEFKPKTALFYYNGKQTVDLSTSGVVISLGGEYNLQYLSLGINFSIVPAADSIMIPPDAQYTDLYDTSQVHTSVYLALRL